MTDPRSGRAEVAVVTITKDDPAGIEATLASVGQQDFSAYEHVVVDGGSSTEVAERLAAWRRTGEGRHLLVDDPPPGIYAAMNAGIRGTSAPVVVVLNGGDTMTPGALRRVSDHHQRHAWRWAMGGVEGRDPDGHRLGEYTFDPYSAPLFRAGLRTVPHPAAYVTRDLYDEVGLYREDLGNIADQEFFLRVARVAEPARLPGILASFQTGGVSSQEGFFGRELAWHKVRLASGTAFGGHAAPDLVVTAALLARLFPIRVVGKLRKIALRGARTPVAGRP